MTSLLYILVLGSISVLRAYVMTQLWAWFVVPTFGFPPLTIGMAFGLVLFVGLFITHPYKLEKEKETTEQKAYFVMCIVIELLLVWAIGAIVSSFL